MNQSTERCTTLFFDLDGTLADPREGITRCLQYALTQLGRPAPPQADLVQYIGPPLRWTFPRLLETDDTILVEAAIEQYRHRYATVGLFENELYAGISELLGALCDEGFRLFVVTSKPTVYAERIVQHFGLAEYFEAVYGPDLDGRFDDKRELVAHILHERAIAPEQSLMIGDRASDIAAGQANGTRTIAVTYGFGSAEELAAANPDQVCHSPHGVLRAVRQMRMV